MSASTRPSPLIACLLGIAIAACGGGGPTTTAQPTAGQGTGSPTGSVAPSSEAPSIGARAFAGGNTNHFLGGGMGLMAHEASHVVQQARGQLFGGMY